MLPPRNQPLGGQYVGAGGALMTPEQVAQQKQIAAALLEQAGDTSPVGHWSAALNRGLQGWLGGRDMYKARQAENQGRAGALEQFNKRLSGNGAVDAVASALSGGVSASPATQGGSVTPVKLDGGKEAFIQALLPTALEVAEQTGVDARIILAQAAQETGWGRSAPNNNFFGIKSHGKGGGGTFATTEYVNGQPVTIRDSFRGYETPADSVRDYGNFLLSNPRYKPMLEASGDIDAQIAALGASGYATDPNYANAIRNIATGLDLSAFGGAGAGTSQAPRAGNVAQIASLLANDWLPEDAKAVLRAEMNQQMQMQNAAYEYQLQQQDPLRQLQMQQAQLGNERSQLELEQMRNPTPKVRYEFAPNGELIAINETGGTVQSMGNFAQSPQAQSAIAKLGADRAAGLISDEEYQIGISKLGNQVNVNMGGGPELGKLSTDYGYVLGEDGLPVIDSTTGLPTAAPVPGSPAALALQKEQESKDKRETSSANTANIVLQDIDKAIEQTSGWTAGLGGRVLGNLPGTGATDLRATTDTIKANIGFDRLQQMREASPTGGALGGIAVQELNMLQAVLGSLDQAQSPDQLRANLARLKEIYEPIAKKAAAYPNAAQFGFDGSEKPAAEQEQPKPRPRYNPTTRSFE